MTEQSNLTCSIILYEKYIKLWAQHVKTDVWITAIFNKLNEKIRLIKDNML